MTVKQLSAERERRFLRRVLKELCPQKKVADLYGVHPATVSNWLAGRRGRPDGLWLSITRCMSVEQKRGFLDMLSAEIGLFPEESPALDALSAAQLHLEEAREALDRFEAAVGLKAA